MKISKKDFKIKMIDLKETDFKTISLTKQIQFIKDYPDLLKIETLEKKCYIVPNILDFKDQFEYVYLMGGPKTLYVGKQYASIQEVLNELQELIGLSIEGRL